MFLYPYPPTAVHFQQQESSPSPSSTAWGSGGGDPETSRIAITYSSSPPITAGGVTVTENHNIRLSHPNKSGLIELGPASTGQSSPSVLQQVLQTHHFTHHDEKPLIVAAYEDAIINTSYNSLKEKCRTCGEEIPQPELIQHMRNHMGPRRCEICQYEAPTKHHLREHTNTHTGLKPYKCSFCEKCFAAKNSLRVHTMYLHTKIRAHQCHHCDQRFVTTSERKSHELVHTDKCPICQTSFRLRGHLRQHMKVHANAAFHHKKR